MAYGRTSQTNKQTMRTIWTVTRPAASQLLRQINRGTRDGLFFAPSVSMKCEAGFVSFERVKADVRGKERTEQSSSIRPL